RPRAAPRGRPSPHGVAVPPRGRRAARGIALPATKAGPPHAILELVNHGSVHTQQEIASALARRGMRATQATISRDIQELGLVRSGAGYRTTAGLVRELVLSVEFITPMAVIRTPP